MRVLKLDKSVMRQLDRSSSPAVRRVEMERGRGGYGFTIAGQAPCVLHGILKGSPAYSVGLRRGDRILRVNDKDVSEESHEVVVKLIGTSSRSLCLLVTSGDRQTLRPCSSVEERGCQNPELYDHKEHQSITGHFGIPCTPDPDTKGCLEFPQTPHSISQFVSVLYSDMGDYFEKLRLKLDSENPEECQQNIRSSDSGIGDLSPEDRNSLTGQRSSEIPNISNPIPDYSQHRNRALLEPVHRCLLSEPLTGPTQTVAQADVSGGANGLALTPFPLSMQFDLSSKHKSSQHQPLGLKARWQKSHSNSVESLVEKHNDGPGGKNNLLPPAMEQIPILRYKPLEDLKHPQSCRVFSSASKQKEVENKGSIFWALTKGRSSIRRTAGRAKRLSLAHSLNDLESAASGGEPGGFEQHDSSSVSSLESNGSLPSVTNHRRISKRRVALWAVSFERLLQDAVAVRYFSLSYKAKDIYNCFLSSKATMPVNIDSQAQLADDVLTAPQPHMFKQPQLQIFNLMKMDSYARFLKSTLYQECIVAEVEGRPLPDSCPIPCSPSPLKHSFISDRSTFSTAKKQCELRNSDSVWEKDGEKCSKACTVTLPDGSSCCVPLPLGASIRQVLLELCQTQQINLAAVDLFLTGGEKPVVLDQESITLSSRNLRLEKRTLFRLDLVPINRSVGLKAKPTKSVTEVLRPVVAKYGLHLGDLVARVSGETDILDLGVPISILDGLRVVLQLADPAKELFELLSRAQSSRVDDQRGLLRKEDLVLPDFLFINPRSEPQPYCCSTPTSHKPSHTTTITPPQAPIPSSSRHPNSPTHEPPPFTAPHSPISRSFSPQNQDEEGQGDMTVVGERFITSPNSTLLPPPLSSTPPYEGSLPEANFTPPPFVRRQPSPGTKGRNACTSSVNHQGKQCPNSTTQDNSPVLDSGVDVDGVTLEDSFEGYAAELRQYQNKMTNGIYSSTEPSCPLSDMLEVNKSDTVQYTATFV
ncbi:Regulator of G-protein signaling 12 [Triplophysa tibetana]|uniref:Regulator of G-protein signaling 12 n=1 Tax=Triplophysa tibetana TaxID=1572043 RepID=A0A5A9PMF3_9TELE|nr:Regulator of G-protein signaling 12 [Triplophysa tibetana]